jgi:hypothetical protein
MFAPRSSLALALSQQLRQPRDVDGDPPRLVRRQDLRLPSLGLVLSRVQVGERLPSRVAHDVAARDLVGPPGRRELNQTRPGGGFRRLCPQCGPDHRSRGGNSMPDPVSGGCPVGRQDLQRYRSRNPICGRQTLRLTQRLRPLRAPYLPRDPLSTVNGQTGILIDVRSGQDCASQLLCRTIHIKESGRESPSSSVANASFPTRIGDLRARPFG